MRLIDADKLKDDLIGRGEYHIANVVVDRQPTVCDIDAIRDEIKELSYPYNLDAMRTKSDVLQIIDKYIVRQSQNDKKCGSYNNIDTFKSCSDCKLIGTDSCYMVCGGSKSLYKPKAK